jgi:hypothetical protein
MAKGRAVAIVLEAGEKSKLTALTRKHGAPQALAERARIVLAAAAGLNNKEIAAKVGVWTAGTLLRAAADMIDVRCVFVNTSAVTTRPPPGSPPRSLMAASISTSLRTSLVIVTTFSDLAAVSNEGI